MKQRKIFRSEHDINMIFNENTFLISTFIQEHINMITYA